jgi:hypothetical protein
MEGGMPSLACARYYYSQQNPFPPPDWRYQLAKAYVAEGVLPSAHRDDADTWEVFRFLRAKDVFQQPQQQVQNVRLKYPDLACAYDMYRGKQKSVRPMLEAYVLSRKDSLAIATDFRVNQETIEWFKKAFYDVDRYLEHPQRVLTQLIGILDEAGCKTLDETGLFKLTSYLGGHGALDKLLYDVRESSKVLGIEGVGEWLAQQTQIMLQMKQLLAANNLKLGDSKQQLQLLGLMRQGGTDKSQSGDAPQTGLLRHVNAMLTEIPWTSGTESEKVYANTTIGEYDRLAAELRDEELLLVAAGEKPPHLEDLHSLQVPASRNEAPTDTQASKPKQQ